MAVQKQDDQHEHTFSNYVRIQDVVQEESLPEAMNDMEKWRKFRYSAIKWRISIIERHYLLHQPVFVI